MCLKAIYVFAEQQNGREHGRFSEDGMQRDLKVAETGLSRLQARVSAVTRS